MEEFAIIDNFFKDFNKFNKELDLNITLPIGDDCAMLDISQINNLLVTTDTLVLGTHFLETAPAHSVGYKSLAVNLSDIAAMGGIPKWFTLSVSMPEQNILWLSEFTTGLSDLAKQYNVSLIGGDLTRGPLSITITVLGIKSHQLLTRNSAKNGDGIFVTGNLGLPSYTLDRLLAATAQDSDFTNSKQNKLYYPQPQINTGIEISKYANAAVDISDGLIADLGHILKQSQVSAEIYLNQLPIDGELLNKYIAQELSQTEIYKYILSGGDEYELLFTAPLAYKEILMNNTSSAISYIGKILPGNEPITFMDHDQIIDLAYLADHCWKNFR